MQLPGGVNLGCPDNKHPIQDLRGALRSLAVTLGLEMRKVDQHHRDERHERGMGNDGANPA